MVETIEKPDTTTDTVTRHIPRYKVIFHNDDKTTMQFVIYLLMNVFLHDEPSAKKVMMEVHQEGAAVAGVYPLEVAEMRQDMCHRLARANKFPLKVTLEPDN